MIQLIDFEPWWRFGAALLIGALLGTEREFVQQRKDSPDFAGIRTFSLIALLGAVTAFMIPDFGIFPAVLALGGLVLLIAASYFSILTQTHKEAGITTEVAVMLTFLLGALVMGEQGTVAIALSVVTALLLSLKGRLHHAIRQMSAEDLRVVLQFALVAAVILPLLPNWPIDPWGLLNPFKIWLVVVLVSGIGFVGYVLMKTLGASRGINLTGLLGGLVSSTATTISFSSASRETPAISSHYSQAVILSSSIMFPRMLLLVLVIYPPLLYAVGIPLGAMLATGMVVVFLLQRQRKADGQASEEQALKLAHPLKLSTAIKFGLFFTVILLIVEFAQGAFGEVGVYVTSALAGLTDVDAITLSVTQLVENDQLQLRVAGTAVLIAAIMNTIVKGFIAYSSGSPELRRIVVSAFGVIVIIGVISGVITILAL
ncbi:MAG: MgtC/SapB family protein [Chloroflexi bacterium]|nr:MgtC/SapB family protein [Chloroflexota bacterium]